MTLLPFLLFAEGERWVHRWAGPGIREGGANAVVCDEQSNVYAAGWVLDSLDRPLWAILSLSSQGEPRWVHTYECGIGSRGGVRAIQLGADGNLYLAGTTWDGSDFFHLTVLSLTASGQERWVRSFGVGSALATSLACDSRGRVYAAGSTWDTTGHMQDMFTVICLDTAGTTHWVYNHQDTAGASDCAYSVVAGADGNVYAAGNTHGATYFDDFAVISLDSAGRERWVYEYDGPAHWFDYALDVSWGDDGSVYAAGYSYESDLTNDDLTVVSLEPDGSERWVYRYVGDWFDLAYDVLCGPDGNVYVSGTSTGEAAYQFTLMSLTRHGVERWAWRYGSGEFDKAYSLAFGADRHIYAAGVTAYPGRVFTTCCLDSAGGPAWVCTTGFHAPREAAALQVVCGGDGNIYAAGSSGDDHLARWFTVASFAPQSGICEPGRQRLETRTRIPGFALGSLRAELTEPVYPVRLTVHDCRGAVVHDRLVCSPGERDQAAAGIAAQLSCGIYILRMSTQSEDLGSTKVVRVR